MISFSSIANLVRQNSLIKDSIWSLIGSVLVKGLGLLAGIAVARFLGSDIYGEYGMIRSTLMNIAIFSTFGLGYTATKFVAEQKINEGENIQLIVSLVTLVTLIVSFLLSVLLFIFSQEVAIYLNAAHLSIALKIFALTIVFNALTTVQIGILSGFNEFKAIAKNNTIVGVFTFITSVVFTYYWNLEGALFALLFVNILNCVLNNIVVKKRLKKYPISKYSNTKPLKHILSFSFPVALQEGLYSLTSWLLLLLLVKFSNYSELGLYSAAMQWSAIILFIPGVLRNVTLSHLSGTINNREKHHYVFRTMLLVSFLATLIPSLIVFLFSNQIYKFYGESFRGLGEILTISVFTTIFSSITNVYAQEFMSKNLNWIVFFIKLIRDISILVIAYFLIINNPDKGASYLVFSSLLMSLLTVVMFYFINKKNG